jgi:hypothetical protein
MGSISNRIKKDFESALNSLPIEAKKDIRLTEKKDYIKFNSWKKSIINALTFLDNDYDLGMPGGDKEKQIFKDELINLLGECSNYKCVSKMLRKTFKNKEILDNIMDKAYENYTTKGLKPKTKDETTTSASSGQYTGLAMFSDEPLFKSNVSIKRKNESLSLSEIEKILKESTPILGTDESTTTGGSSGAYVGPAIWAKNRDNWRGKIKTWHGGKFVSVKEKCKKYPYCNQSPEAITLSDVPLDKLDNVFERLSKKTNKPYSYIKRVFFKHFDLK